MDEELRTVLHDVYDILQITYDRILPLLDLLHHNQLEKYVTKQLKYGYRLPHIPQPTANLLDIYGKNHSLVQLCTNSYLLGICPRQQDLYHLYE